MSREMETCELCAGTGCDNHPDSGQVCSKCDGAGAYVREDAVQQARDEAFEKAANWLQDRANTCLEYNQPGAAGMTLSYASAIRDMKGGAT